MKNVQNVVKKDLLILEDVMNVFIVAFHVVNKIEKFIYNSNSYNNIK